jgi:hypothetical protein
MAESVTDAENGIMDTLEHGKMSKGEIFDIIKKAFKLKKHEFNTAWKGLIDDGEITSSGGMKWKLA